MVSTIYRPFEFVFLNVGDSAHFGAMLLVGARKGAVYLPDKSLLESVQLPNPLPPSTAARIVHVR